MHVLAAVLAAWVIVLAALLWLLLGSGPGTWEPAAPPPDPYEGEMTQWRRAVHDWTRDN